MRRNALIIATITGVLVAVPAVAQDWTVLRGDAVRAALEGRKVVYPSGAWQDFRASGKTLYNAGRDSWGNWRVQGDQYCSQWPPSDLWACYDMMGNDVAVRFIGTGEDITDGTYVD